MKKITPIIIFVIIFFLSVLLFVFLHQQKNTRKLVHVNYSEKQKERIEKQDLQFDIHSESDFPSLN